MCDFFKIIIIAMAKRYISAVISILFSSLSKTFGELCWDQHALNEAAGQNEEEAPHGVWRDCV